MISLLAVSIAPVILLLVFIYKKDRFEKEPIRVLIKAFFGGVLAVLLVLFLAQIFPETSSNDPFISSLLTAFLQAAIPEELAKFLFLYLFIWKNKYFDEYFDGIVYAVFVSLGFACVENILYVYDGGISVGISRAIFAIPAHFLFGVIMGYFFSLARFSHHRVANLLAAVVMPILAHGIYDFILMFLDAHPNEIVKGLLILLFFGFNILLWIIGSKRIKRLSGK